MIVILGGFGRATAFDFEVFDKITDKLGKIERGRGALCNILRDVGRVLIIHKYIIAVCG